MKKSKFTEGQISYALRQVEAGTPVLEVCRRLGITEQTFYRWKKKFAGMGVAELRIYKLEGLSLRLKTKKRQVKCDSNSRTLSPCQRERLVVKRLVASRRQHWKQFRIIIRVLHVVRAMPEDEVVWLVPKSPITYSISVTANRFLNEILKCDNIRSPLIATSTILALIRSL